MIYSIQITNTQLEVSSKIKTTHKRPKTFIKIKLHNLFFDDDGLLFAKFNNLRLRPHRHRPIVIDIDFKGKIDLLSGDIIIDGSCICKSNSEVNVKLASFNLICKQSETS